MSTIEEARIIREFPGMIDVEVRYTGNPPSRKVSAKLAAFIRKYNREHGTNYVRVSSGGSMSSSVNTATSVYSEVIS